MTSSDGKRKALADVTNVDSPIVPHNKKQNTTKAFGMMPISLEPNHQPLLAIQSSIFLQNVLPALAMFKHDSSIVYYVVTR